MKPICAICKDEVYTTSDGELLHKFGNHYHNAVTFIQSDNSYSERFFSYKNRKAYATILELND